MRRRERIYLWRKKIYKLSMRYMVGNIGRVGYEKLKRLLEKSVDTPKPTIEDLPKPEQPIE